MKQLLHYLAYYWRDFRKQKKRALLTIAAITWGTFSILMLLAFGEGIQRQLHIAGAGLGNNLLVVWGGSTTKPFEGLPRGRSVRFDEEDVELVQQQIPEIAAISGEYSRWGVPISYGKKLLSERTIGVYPDFGEMRSQFRERGGRFINWTDFDRKRRVIFLGYELKQKLFGDVPAVGEQVLLNHVPFTVVGVGRDKQQMGMYGGPDVNMGVIPATTFKTLFGYRYYNNLVIQPDRDENAEYVKDRLYAVLGGKHKFDPTDENTLGIWDVIENRVELNKMMFGIQIFLGIVGGMTLLIAGVGVANIMMVVVRERTREIGIKLALGAKRLHILNGFLLEALAICFTGGAAGIIISLYICELLARIPRGGGDDAMSWLGTPTISVPIAIVTVIILGVVGIASGVFPALRAARVNPVDSLRYE